MKTSIDLKIIIGFIATLCLFIMGSIYTYLNNEAQMKAANMVSHSNAVLFQAERILDHVLDAETSQRGYLITRDTSFLVPYLRSRDSLKKHISKFNELVSDNKRLQDIFSDTLVPLIEKRLGIISSVLSLGEAEMQSKEVLGLIMEGNNTMESIRRAIQRIQEDEQALLQTRSKENTARMNGFLQNLLMVAVVFSVFLTLMFYLVYTGFRMSNKAQMEVKEASKEIKDLYDNAPCGYFSVDHTITITNINKTLLEWLGYDLDEVVGKLKFYDLLTPDGRKAYLESFKEDFEKYERTGSVFDLEFDFQRKDGSVLTVSVNSSAIKDHQGKFLKSRSAVFDLAERKKAEGQFKEVIEAAPDGLIIVNEDGKIKLMNRQAETMFGYEKEELIGLPVETLVPQQLRKSHGSNMARYFEQPVARPMGMGLDLQGLKKSGAQFPLEISLSPMAHQDGLFAIAAVRDVTERKQAEKIISEMAAIVESSEDAIISHTLDGTIFTWNRSAESLYGYTSAEMIGEDIKLIIPEGMRPLEAEFRNKVRNGESIKHFETIRRRKDGTLVDIALTISPIRTKNGMIAGCSKVARDIREQKKRENEILELNKELEAFTYSVSHDLRAPLRSLSGYAQILMEDYAPKLDPEAQRVTNVIIRNAKRMGMLIDDLLEFSKLGRRPPATSKFDMNELVAGVLAEYVPARSNPPIEMDVKDLTDCMADRKMIYQVWANLISNAIKYSGKREVARIEIGSMGLPGECAYFVKDNGVGFDMEYADKLFAVFSRLHRMDEYEGTGVGLAQVKRIVQKHGGRVWAEAQLDVGATFYFTIPIK